MASLLTTAVAALPGNTGGNVAASMNPPFHPNILRIFGSTDSSDWASFNLYRGAIVKEDGSKGVRFLYNPSQVGIQHPMSPDQPPIPGAAAPDGTNLAAPSGTVTFSLLFDRTYECWYDHSHAGVLVDVRAFYALTGILDDGGNVAPTAIKAMTLYPAYVYLGQNGPKNNIITTRPLAYYGYISSLTITYTHWSINMIPMRCAVDVTFSLIPGNGSDNGTGPQTVPAGTPPAAGPPTPGSLLPGPGDGPSKPGGPKQTPGFMGPVGLGFG